MSPKRKTLLTIFGVWIVVFFLITFAIKGFYPEYFDGNITVLPPAIRLAYNILSEGTIIAVLASYILFIDYLRHKGEKN